MGGDTLLVDGVVSLTGAAADRLLRTGDGDAALLYLALLRTGRMEMPQWDGGRVQRAAQALLELGLVKAAAVPAPPPAPVPEPAEEPPDYATADITGELGGNPTFRALADELERKLGRKLSLADLKSLYTMYDFLALPAEVILMLSTWCGEEVERKYGPGRKPRMPQIKKEAFRWKRRGIDTVQAAEEFLKKQSLLSQREREILPLLGILNRVPIDRERKYIAAWVEQGFENEALRLAYEKTILRKQSMDWGYMNGILRSWHAKGLHTVAEIERRDAGGGGAARPVPAAPAAKAPAPNGFHADDAKRVREDLERTRRLLEKLKQDEGGEGHGL